MIESISCVIPEITVHNNRPVTTSIAVANFFGKEHKNVLQKIRSLECSPAFTTANFSAVVVTVTAGFNDREIEAYEMTKNGFIFLVMGFTGKKAAAFKETYIAEFDRMEIELAKRQSQPPTQPNGDYSILTYFENHIPVCSRPIMPDEIVMSFDSFSDMAKRKGLVVISFQMLANMTTTGIAGLIEDTRQAYLKALPF
ncbi:Rha family transcriptional regulator [Lelliottia wanjuensis]|uniref:Rha family transcriptional regulator n=1 Tax=Lelliottia wanjuensis TaxID=3050585 RepID=UPI0036F44EC1